MARASGTDLASVSPARPAATRWSRAGSGAGGAGEAVIGVDAILDDAELQERLALGGRTLPVGGTARVSDERCRHGGEVYG